MTLRIKKSGSQFYVQVKASNGQILAHSEQYTTKQSARHCADVIKASAGSAQIVDDTI